MTLSFWCGNLFAEFKKKSADEWSNIFKELKIPADQDTANKFFKQNDTLEKIQKQTRSSLAFEKWVEIFKKINAEPKKDMKPEEWDAFFQKISLSYQPDPVLAQMAAGSKDAAKHTELTASATSQMVAAQGDSKTHASARN